MMKLTVQQSYSHQFNNLIRIYISKIVMNSSFHEAHYTCNKCNNIIRQSQRDQHTNLHTKPKDLVPRTLPNSTKHIGLAKVLHLDDTTDESDIAVRSILPDEVPKPQQERRNVQAPESTGLAKRTEFMEDKAVPINQRFDLNSNIVGTGVQNYSQDPLNIEKVVDLKPIKTIVAKKEIQKYKNTNSSAQEIVDMGGCDKKVQSVSLSQSRNLKVSSQPVYQIKEDVRPFLTLASNPNTSSKVNFSRKTGPASDFVAVGTKSNLENPTNSRPNAYYQQILYDQVEDSQINAKKEKLKDNNRNRPQPYPTHPNECSSCHGFYCSTCKSTIPPKYRPFWDQNERPELIKYYQSLQKQAEKNNCVHCHPKKQE